MRTQPTRKPVSSVNLIKPGPWDIQYEPAPLDFLVSEPWLRQAERQAESHPEQNTTKSAFGFYF
jgi:hypothetical protein